MSLVPPVRVNIVIDGEDRALDIVATNYGRMLLREKMMQSPATDPSSTATMVWVNAAMLWAGAWKQHRGLKFEDCLEAVSDLMILPTGESDEEEALRKLKRAKMSVLSDNLLRAWRRGNTGSDEASEVEDDKDENPTKAPGGGGKSSSKRSRSSGSGSGSKSTTS